MKKNLLIVVAVAALSGCAVPRYQWGNYDEMLYQAYKNPAKVEQLRTSLEAHISSLEGSKQKVPPGLYAELGTLYLQSGDAKKASMLYSKEREAWPESRGLMDALTKNIERRNPSEGARQ